MTPIKAFSRAVIAALLLSLLASSSADAQFIWPVGGRVSSNFDSPRGNVRHGAIDIATPVGTDIGASYPGSISLSRWENANNHSQGYGLYMRVAHPDSYSTLYAHLSQNLFGVGPTVGLNQVIARSGNTGSSTGPHLHFEIRQFNTKLRITAAINDRLSRGAPVPNSYSLPPAGCTVGGAIRVKYDQLGGAGGFLGRCTTSELTTPDGVGRYNHFEGGSIYWTPSLGAWSIKGAIRDRWAALGWERSILGYPRSDETGVPAGGGAYSVFQNGYIYWSPATGAHELRGAIEQKWRALGAEQGYGYPTTDESPAAGEGRYNHFDNGPIPGGGSIYWTPQTGAHEIHGAIRDKWASLNWEHGCLGFPTSDEHDFNGGRRNTFQRGVITWTPAGGAVASCQ